LELADFDEQRLVGPEHVTFTEEQVLGPWLAD